MKKVGIITLDGYGNFGNRLQNYALTKKVNEIAKCETIWKTEYKNFKTKHIIKSYLGFLKKYRRISKFIKFTNKYIKTRYVGSINEIEKQYDYFITGSDQVWNVTFPDVTDDKFLAFSPKSKNISYAASIGINSIPEDKKKKFIKRINNIKYLSVREDRGKEIIEELTERTDVEVLVDPTMLLTAEEWDKVSKKPNNFKKAKFILNYFLGELSEERKNEIKKIAKENNCEIINIYDKNSPYYDCGPSEFLYLEKHAFLICTDSFHSSVFAILYNRPFVVFNREPSNDSMTSRLDTLINKFQLKNRKFEGKITQDNLSHDYTEAYKILENERKKANKFLRNAIDIKGSDLNG